jgi:hypothetical protein
MKTVAAAALKEPADVHRPHPGCDHHLLIACVQVLRGEHARRSAMAGGVKWWRRLPMNTTS